MNKYFSPNFFKKNRQKLRSELDQNFPIVISANGLVQRNSDISYPFRQDSNFWYLTGITEPDLILVIDAADEYLITAERDEVRTAFDGNLDVTKHSKESGIGLVYEETQGWQRLAKSLKARGRVYTLEPPELFDVRHGIYTNPARRALVAKINKLSPKVDCIDIRKQLAHLRMIKQPEEIFAIQKAVDLTAEALTGVKNNLLKFSNEWQIHDALNRVFSSNLADHAYQPIVAGGKNACTLHYVDNNACLEENLVLIDAGAEWSNYASDITRTYARKTPSERERAIFDSVIEVQDFAMSVLKPGLKLKDYELQVEKFMGQKLNELGLIRDTERASIRKYYPHATSHFLGLDTHDTADYDTPLSEGMVLTVEPGIYVPEEGIGVRVEDDILITKKGHQNLSEKLSRTLH